MNAATRLILFGGPRPEARAVFAAMTTAPASGRRGLIDRTIRSLVSSGAWSKLDYLQVYAAHDSQAGTVNWKNPATFQATLVNSPSFTMDRGFTTNGTTSEVDTGFNPSTAAGSFLQDSASFGIWSLTSDQNASSPAGWFDGTDGVTINTRSTGNAYGYRINQATADGNASSTDGAGLFAVNRSASNAHQAYKNGSSADTGTAASTALNDSTLRLGRSTATGYAAVQFAASFAGGSLDATEHDAIYDALLVYMQAVGAAA